MAVLFEKTKLLTDKQFHYCPGCNHGIIHRLVAEAIDELKLDGNVIGPKILGSSIGINGFWVMFSIILGAGLFGFWGMLLGVPVFVVIYTAINNHIDKKLKASDLPWETADYVGVDYIDPVTYERVMKRRPGDAEDGEDDAPAESK